MSTATVHRPRRRRPPPQKRTRPSDFEKIDARYAAETEPPCACSPNRPCGLHWSRMDDTLRRAIAHRLGVQDASARWSR